MMAYVSVKRCTDLRRRYSACRGDVVALELLAPEASEAAALPADLVYMDPPYVPRSDDNCYVKRYHFVEGLMSHWQAPEVRIMPTSKVKKLEKRRTPFSYRSQALDAFDRLFARFAGARLALSYSSNGWPDLPVLVDLMKAHKRRVKVKERPHRYSFGTHGAVHSDRAKVTEYLIVGE